jgi:hypothetical protein
MERLSLLVDEHVPRVFTGALRSTGFAVTTAQERYGQESVDSSIFDDCAEEGLVIVTNDRDFVRLAAGRDHAGVIVYTDRRFLLDDPLAAAGAIANIDRQYTSDEIRNTVEWLDNWQ